MRKIIALMLASSVIFLAQTTLQAAEVKTAHNIMLRNGPGSHYTMGKKIAARTPVHIGVCNPAWCHVSTGKQSGWVETTRLIPNFAQKMARTNQAGDRQTAKEMQVSGSSGVFRAWRPHASTSMVVRMRIISKEEAARQGMR